MPFDRPVAKTLAAYLVDLRISDYIYSSFSAFIHHFLGTSVLGSSKTIGRG